jgi:hypothetical protein
MHNQRSPRSSAAGSFYICELPESDGFAVPSRETWPNFAGALGKTCFKVTGMAVPAHPSLWAIDDPGFHILSSL